MSKIKRERKREKLNKYYSAALDEEEESEDEELSEAKKESLQNENISQSGMIVTKKNDIAISSLTVIGQIEGHYTLSPNNKTTKYEHIIPHLVAVEENAEIEGLLIILNTVGGDVEAGLAIAEMIASMRKPTVSLVLGGGHSIGVPLAVSAKKSFIVPSATMTIHPVRMNGLVVGVEQSFSYFTKMQERINNFIVAHSNINEKKLREFMFNTGELATDVGSIVDGQSALKAGLIDHIGGLSDALAKLRDLCRKEKNNASRIKRVNRSEQENSVHEENKVKKSKVKNTGMSSGR